MAATRIAGFTPEQAEAIIAAVRDYSARFKLDGTQPPAGIQRWQRPRLLTGMVTEQLNSTDKPKAAFAVDLEPINEGTEDEDPPENALFAPETIYVQWYDEWNSGFDQIEAGTKGEAEWIDNKVAFGFRPYCGLLARDWYCTPTGIVGVYDGNDPPEGYTAGPFETKAEAEANCQFDWYCTPEGCVSVEPGGAAPEGATAGPFNTEQGCEDDGCLDWYCTPDGCVSVLPGADPPAEALAGPYETESLCAANCDIDWYCMGTSECVPVLSGTAPPPGPSSGPYDTEDACLEVFPCADGAVVWGCYDHPVTGWTCISWLSTDGPPGGVPPEAGPYTTEAECAGNCPPPGTLEEGWYCIEEEGEPPNAVDCVFADDESDIPVGWVIVSGPYASELLCNNACGGE